MNYLSLCETSMTTHFLMVWVIGYPLWGILTCIGVWITGVYQAIYPARKTVSSESELPIA